MSASFASLDSESEKTDKRSPRLLICCAQLECSNLWQIIAIALSNPNAREVSLNYVIDWGVPSAVTVPFSEGRA
jgi:hypothetical protein